MRKITVLNRISLDGFFAGPHGEIDWFIHDPEVDKAAHEMMHPDTLLLGRTTYQMFESYWPGMASDTNASPEAKATSDELTQMNKLVFSTTLKEVAWENSSLVEGDLIEEVNEMKQGEGSDITIFGSGSVVQQLAKGGLIDEYLIILTPVVLGTGKSLFGDVKKINLKVMETREFNSGNVLIHFKVDQYKK